MHGNRCLVRISALILAAVFFFCGREAMAHRVYVFAWVEGGTVYTESYFGGKRKVKGGTIHVYDPAGKEIVTGKTDEKGLFAFPVPGRMDLKIVLDATAGHRAEYLLAAGEVPETDEGQETPAKVQKEPRPATGESTGADIQAIRAVVEEELDERLNPIARSVSKLMQEQEQEPGITEVLGGIGYIVGLAGIYMYARSRKRG